MKALLTRIIASTIFVAVLYGCSALLGPHMELLRIVLVALCAAPLLGRVFAPDVINFLSAIKKQAHHEVFAPWNGRFYIFDGNQVRFFLIDDVVWIAADDICHLLNPKPTERDLRLLGSQYRRIEEIGLLGISESGLMRLIELRTGPRNCDRNMIRLRNWLAKEALPNIKRLPSSATARF